MTFTVREMGLPDRKTWAAMRASLWPEDSAEAHAGEIDRMLADADMWGFVAETTGGATTGFAEVAVRKYANGCMTRPVPFPEGIWVEPEFRRQGAGRALIEH